MKFGFERPQMPKNEKPVAAETNPTPEAVKVEQENDVRHEKAMAEYKKLDAIVSSEFDAKHNFQMAEFNLRVAKEDNKPGEEIAKLAEESSNAKQKLAEILRNKIDVKDGLRNMPGKEGLEGLSTEKDKAELANLEQ